ncbi:MAG: NAD-dependent epimerase/dehydratase [Rickettsiales bacterium]|jgi:UDP-glucose 4-epimerase|nr:NAD-dependent epimerase/dehydratase [Rickettsiales bacterium]
MQHLLVTGGQGYIGSHMVRLLLNAGYRVTVLDNNAANRPNILTHPNLFIVEGDIRDTAILHYIFTTYPIHGVLHFAGLIQVGESVQKPDKYYDNNVTGTLTLLNAMVAHGVKYCIFSSSASVFGEPHYAPIDEQHPIAPLSPYGRSKQMVEEIFRDYERAYGMRWGALRYFNAAGCDVEAGIGERHEPETHLIPLALQVACGRKASLSVFGQDYNTPDGTCIRDYIHVNDLASAHLLLLQYLEQGGEERLFNLGTGLGYSVLEIIREAKAVTGQSIAFTLEARRPGDSAILVADGKKARALLGWEPRASGLTTLLEHAWAWEQRLALEAANSYTADAIIIEKHFAET